ncbi:transforming growth factor beta regulator 1-like isoform X2 [Dendronephthya gigantea]|uniref:transforming growth factor beta regulator 1-like isoform X2 n=1 Tax=Dendronephthya gigantea TaxID=151771 RepID=UPI00106C3B2F|nr:transforming growth factor beta regulator 1-like isoform X2 [Dendronephthya gigantea]
MALNSGPSSSHNVTPPLPFLSMSNGEDLGSNNLFPSLSHVNNDVSNTMDTLPVIASSEEQNSSPVHMNQTKQDEMYPKPKAVVEPPKRMPGHHHSHTRELNLIKYKKKYQRLKKLVKRLIFENAAIADEIVQTDAKFQRAKVERKFLLKQLLEYHSMPREPLPPPMQTFIPPPPPEILVHPSPEIQLPPTIQQSAKPKAIKVRIKKVAPPAKSKKETEVTVAATKGTIHVEETKSNEASTSPQDAKGDPPVKPKRKKPGTAIKRKVQPIPVDAKGKPVFPIVLGGLTVHSLGDIVWDRPGFHSERYIWPVGFCSSRYYPSMKTPDMKCIYTCKILDGGYGPTFVMSPEDDSENSIEASSATACHCVVLKAINKARGKEATNTGSGPEFFGFSHPTIQYLLQSLPNARKCAKYQWVKFELPKGKTSESSMDESSPNTMRNLTLTSAASNISEVPSPGFDSDMLGFQLKSTSGDPSLDLGTPISPPQSSLSSPLQLSPKMNASTMSPSASSQPSFIIPPSSPLFHFDDDGLPD